MSEKISDSGSSPSESARLARDRSFAPPEMSGGLKRASARGGAATAIGQVFNFFLRFASTAVLARLLTPEDYGLIAMTAAVSGFLGMFRDAGLTWATVQREVITHAQVSTLFWINVALGCLLAGLLAALSPAVAAFYGEPRLIGVTCALAIVFVLGGLTVQHMALLNRQLRFLPIAVLQVVTASVSVAVAVATAAAGWRYWSLVAMIVAGALVDLIGAWILVSWRPSLPKRGSGVMPMLKFGSDIVGFSVVNYFSRNADNILIGWRWGSVTLGLYDKAYTLLLFPVAQINAPLSSVVVPTLSRVKADPIRFNEFFGRALQLVAIATVPAVVGIAIFAHDLVNLWLGPGWEESATLFQFLAPAALAGAFQNPMGWILIATGQTRRYQRVGFVISIVVVASFVIGLPFGGQGVAIAYSIASCVLLVSTWPFIVRGTSVTMRLFYRSILPAFGACIPAAAGALVVQKFGAFQLAGLWRTALAAALFAGVYVVILLVVFRKWSFFREILADLMPEKAVAVPHGGAA